MTHTAWRYTFLIAAALGSVSCARRVTTAAVIPEAVSPHRLTHAHPEAEDSEESESPKDAAEFFLARRLAVGETELSIDRYRQARQHIAAMPRATINSAGWTSLGPGNVGGRTRSLVINPQNPNIMYAGAVTGGVWKSSDGGQTWNTSTDMLPVLNVGALAMDPTDPNTIYAGTGEYYGGFPGQGIFKTADGGNTWTQLPEKFTYINKIAISPNNHLRLYAAAEGGMYASSDGGQTWKQVVSGTNSGCQDLVIRTDQKTDYLFASCSGATLSAAYQILRNTDAAGSGTWQAVQSTPQMGLTALAIAPSQPSTIYALAGINTPNSTTGVQQMLAVYRSASNGDPASWTTQATKNDANVVNTLLLSNSRNALGSYCTGGALGTYAGGWSNVIAVDPLDPNRVWAGGVDVFRSDDGGLTWGAASLYQVARTSPLFAHADRHVFAFHPAYDGSSNQTMYQANDGGVFRTDNARAAVSTGQMGACETQFLKNSAVMWVNLNHSFVATQFYHGVAYQGGQVYFGGSQDNSLERGTDVAGGNGWIIFQDADGGAVAVDPADANQVFAETERLAQQRATDGGTFNSAITGITEDADNFPFEAYLATDPNNGRHMFLGGTTNLWRSTDGAATWTAAAPVEASSGIGAIAVSPLDSNTVLFGTNLGYIYRSSTALASNGSTTWASSQPRSGVVAGITFDRTNPNLVYATYSTANSTSTEAHVYKSVDAGVTWTPSDGSGASSVPNIPVFRLIENPYNPSQLYLATDLGVLISLDGGATWDHDPNAFSDVVVEDLGIDQGPNPQYLFAFTYGRGTYRIPLPGAPVLNCTYVVSATSTTVDGLGGVTPISVTAPPGGPWVAIPGSQLDAFTIQSPAQGIGPGTAYLWSSPNPDATTTDTITIANTQVQVTQGTTAPGPAATDSMSSAPALTVPSYAQFTSTSFTSNSGDPVHSCTGSADFKTAWWRVTPQSSGLLLAHAASIRTDVFGNAGVVLTAYAQSAPSVELGCAIVPRDTNSEIDAIISFAVTSGSTYLIEVSATGGTSADGGLDQLVLTMGGPASMISVSPTSAILAPGSSPQQFTAKSFNSQNAAARWSISPALGHISTSGLYTPPASLSAPATVTVTATSFADPTKIARATIALTTPAPGSQPVISLVLNTTGEGPGLSQNTWIEVKGSNLAPDTRIWQGSDFVNGQMPTSLDGVRVTVNGKPAYVYYIDHAQVNVLTPIDSTVGTVSVQLSNSFGSSNVVTASLQAVAPGFFVFDSANHVAATHLDGSLIGPTNLYPGASTPAKPGEQIVIYGNGFGNVAATIAPGSVAQFGALPTLPAITIGGYPATVQFAGLVAPGEFQFNVVVPALAPDGDNVLTAAYNGSTSQSGVLVTVQR